jgi:hypothetical protein
MIAKSALKLKCIVLLLLATLTVSAQIYTGSVTGVVDDPSGAVVPGARITLTETSRNYNYSATTDATGRYSLRSLPPGTYTLRVESAGFSPFQRTNIVVDVNGNVQANASLNIKVVGESIAVVDTSAPLLQTEDSVTGQTVNRTFINSLPLVGRNPADLAFLAPGVTQPAAFAFGTGSSMNNFVSDGSRNSTADILMDGVSVNNYEQNSGVQVPIYTPPVEAIEEFRLQQSNFSAEIGFSSATIVNLVLKSGTNSFHGEAYGFVRNKFFDANNFFANAAGQPLPSLHWDDFGGTVAGPIIKNKTFFFFDYDGIRSATPSTASVGVPSVAERAGDFSELCTRNGGTFSATGLCSADSGQIWDPFTGVYDPSSGATIRQNYIPFNNIATYQSPGNPLAVPFFGALAASPGNLIDPVGQKLMNMFPLPNVNVGTGAYNPYANFFATGANTSAMNSYDVKIDHRFTDNDLLSLRLSQQWGKNTAPNFYGNEADVNSYGTSSGINELGSLNYTRTLSPRTVLSLTLGYGHAWTNTSGLGAEYPGTSAVKTLGMPAYIGLSGVNEFPTIQFGSGGYNSEGLGMIGYQGWALMHYASETAHLVGSLDHMFGSHELKVGGELRRHRINFLQVGAPAGNYSFSNAGTAQSSYGAGGGDPYAGLLIGYDEGWGEYEIPLSPATQNYQYGGFVQDNWHVNQRLTLNIGMRYDIDTPRTERYNRMSYFDPYATSPLAGKVPADACAYCANLLGAMEFVGVDGNPRSQVDTYHGAIGPRFGFAYKLTNNTTVRGGYGMFYDPATSGAAGTGAGGFSGFSQLSYPMALQPGNTGVPFSFLRNPFPPNGNPIQLPPGASAGSNYMLGFTPSGPVPEWDKLPQEQTWSFGLERQLPWSVLVDAEYVGRKGTHLYCSGCSNLDVLPPNIAAAYRANPAAFNATVPSPFANFVPSSSALASDISAWQLFLPYPQYSGVSTSSQPVGDSIYNGLQIRVEKRFSEGLQFLFTYTKQKSIDDSSVASGNILWLGGIDTGVQDPNNLRLERGLSNFDISQTAMFSFVYQLPFGHHMRWGARSNNIANGILGGWQLNGMYRWDTGVPVILSLVNGVNVPTYGAQRADLTGTPFRIASDYGTTLQYFVDPGVGGSNLGGLPPAFTDGNAPRVMPNLRQPGTDNLSASLFKQFPLGFREGAKAEFRLEAFNALNRVQFCGPATAIGQDNFGSITCQANQPRQVQLGLKLYF